MSVPELSPDVRRAYSFAPFWFWNDRLDGDEIVRQLRDFRFHGVWSVVIHNRVGLPRGCGWMSECLLHHTEIAIREAESLGMTVYLYDEGMYPSGSAAGRVVERDPTYANRGLELVTLHPDEHWSTRCAPDDDAKLVGEYTTDDGRRVAVVDRRTHAWIRGLHYRREPDPDTPHSDGLEETHPAGDILNPAAVACFIEESYERYYDRFGRWFGTTVTGIFTDEPSLLGRSDDAALRPGTLAFLERARDEHGVDLFDRLWLLWDDGPPAESFRRRYEAALDTHLSEVYYRPIAEWCERHSVALVGHPERPDALAHLRHFQIPGQDMVLRRVIPGEESGIAGPESTQAKAAASVMMHEGRARNANEFCGAYGLGFTFEEMQRLAFWLLVRGCNLLMPHAFYYSVRGPRRTERPPDVGPKSGWWERFAPFADLCTWLSRLNAEGTPLCDVAVLSGPSRLPWRVPALLFENQVDFAYVGRRDLERATVDAEGVVTIGRGAYRVLVSESGWSAGLPARFADRCTIVDLDPDSPGDAIERIRAGSRVPGLIDTDAPDIRFRAVREREGVVAMVFNESAKRAMVTLRAPGPRAAGLLSREIASFGLLVVRLDGATPRVIHEHTP
ncbi:MAG: hypothetical protein ACOC2D_03350 [Spirochaetota bacterium]